MKSVPKKIVGPPFHDDEPEEQKHFIDGKVMISDKGETCRHQGCTCVCYHVHDEVAGLFVMDDNKHCKLHTPKTPNQGE